MEQSSKEENESVYNGGGLGLKGSAACARSLAGFEEVSRAPKSLRRVQRHIEGFKDIPKTLKDIEEVRRMSGTWKDVGDLEGCRGLQGRF